MKRMALLALLLSCAAAEGRVLSYSPYTDQLSVRGDHRRTTRHFVLIETDPYDRTVYSGRVVLYDSKEIDEPRVIFPKTQIYFAALWQDHDHATPVILIGTRGRTYLSGNGGRSWRQLKELDGLVPFAPGDVDYGGPWTRGLSSAVRIGTSRWPFVVSYHGSVYAIPAAGPPRLLVRTMTVGGQKAIGQNREGTEFVIVTGLHTVAAVSLDGTARPIGRLLPFMDAAWIAPDGSVYAIVHRSFDDGRTISHYRELHLYRNRRSQLVYRQKKVAMLAVPTHDFSGAWIAEVGFDSTTLMRHRPGRTLETMWKVDEERPEIEALHAGAAGDKVLIQVHRPRAAQSALVDPALAIWRVGDPPPAEYDELFLREGPYKGFVHLDVDKMAAGELFVFDSSFVRPAPPEPVSAPIGGADDVLQEWGVVRASLRQRLVLPGAVRGEYLTDLLLNNPLPKPQKVAITFDGATRTITLDRESMRLVPDVLGTLFGIAEGSGTLHFDPEVGINVRARVYTRRGGGTLGYVAGAIDTFNVISARFPVTFSGALPGDGFRTRLLLTDMSGGNLKADVTTTSPVGLLGTSTIDAKNFVEEDTRSATPGGLIVQPARGRGIAGVVVVDERSGDPTYFPPDLPAATGRTIPFIAHTNELRSDLQLLNYSSQPRSITIEVKQYDNSQWPRAQTYTLKPYESRVIHDPLKTLFNLTGFARLRYWSGSRSPADTSGVRATARTYRTAADGGTSGTLVPSMNDFQSVTSNESLELLTPVGSLRVTLGLVDHSPTPGNNATMKLRVTVYDQANAKLGSFVAGLVRARGMLIEDLFKTHNLAVPAAARIVVEPLDNIGMVSGFVVLTDPVTEDTSFVTPLLGAKN